MKLLSGSWVGVSVKQSKAATKTNYSVERLLSCGTELSELRLRFLREAGFPSFRKEDRTSVNALFYDEMNPYWVRLR